MSLSARGFQLAAVIHAGQRYGRDPYLTHCSEVRDVIAYLYPDDEVLQVAAGLHAAIEDAPEDVDARALIYAHCGVEVLALVEAKTLPQVAAAGWRAVAIKLADRLCDVDTADRRAVYRREYPAFRAALFPVSEDRPELRPLWVVLDKLCS